MPYKIQLDEFGYRVGSLKSQAAALYSNGATREAVKELLGSTQLNLLAELESRGFMVTRKRVRIGKNRPHYFYKVQPKEEK